ncbi:Nif3-like dinuclear metal center hexameric protein [Orenia marismortui]|uniref:Nif3-like dinuclear metal center hexameric protein n=1 Tax=Orenia marismortui TaxID=46469 RepID=UPI00037A7872|nr:Nif3-like dinuclear metal center hexameric protein [Orenia marismortui]
MSVKLQQVTNLINKLAPKNLAYEWDNIGLQIGDYNQEVDKVLVTLDVNQQVLEEAIEKDVDLIVAHHPVIFKGISNLRFNTPLGKLIQKAIKNNISIYVAHTNYDIAEGGLNDILAKKLQLTNTDILQVTKSESLKKLVVFVPVNAINQVKEAMGKAGADWIGNYSNCFFEQEGVGSFKPLADSNPYLGSKGEINQVEEYRLETIVPSKILHKVINKMLKAHPYEEVAYDIYPLDNQGQKSGIGRIGYLKEAIVLEEYIKLVKEKLELENLKLVGDIHSQIHKVAICSGSGADFIKTASFKGADLLVTGDIKYHDAQLAEEKGISLIDVGHYGTEKIMKDAMVEYLLEKIKKNNLKVGVLRSEINTNPFQII